MKSAVLKKSAAAALMLLGSVAAQAAGVTVTVSCGTVGQDFEFCKKAADEWSTKTGNTVKHLTIPQSRRCHGWHGRSFVVRLQPHRQRGAVSLARWPRTGRH